ncbi:MAG: hypothetical protein LBR90_01695, partial [Elusimicrobiota bacterium]|nr:hypothetical protein [Elusimicrobiota bacterium]
MPYKNTAAKLVFFAPASYRLRAWVCAAAAVLLALAALFDFSGSMRLFIYTLAFFWGGELFLRGAFRELLKLYAGFNAFMAVCAFCAFAVYVIDSFAPAPFLKGGYLFLPVTLALANFIKAAELSQIGGAFRFIETLDNFISRSAIKIEDGREVKVFTKEVRAGDIILIKTARRVPVDCRVIKGKTLMD